MCKALSCLDARCAHATMADQACTCACMPGSAAPSSRRACGLPHTAQLAGAALSCKPCAWTVRHLPGAAPTICTTYAQQGLANGPRAVGGSVTRGFVHFGRTNTESRRCTSTIVVLQEQIDTSVAALRLHRGTDRPTRFRLIRRKTHNHVRVTRALGADRLIRIPVRDSVRIGVYPHPGNTVHGDS
ncbi:LAMI_0F10770g1_1 [Lachancea mirantina]|uniref:LAMI_0F10770g1_1 n=1 Tax=Lachancea mirantina TaxID=1230905 RepID=A0A1G4K209_9SACH|nr:LAMI_0F10770g1_1 [Lachancea mirantina]